MIKALLHGSLLVIGYSLTRDTTDKQITNTRVTNNAFLGFLMRLCSRFGFFDYPFSEMRRKLFIAGKF